MSPALSTLLLFGTLFLLLAVGVPFAFAIGTVSLIGAVAVWGMGSLAIVSVQTMGIMQNAILLAVPLFILMANFLQRSGIADDMYGLMYSLLGRVRGGLAVGTVLICTVFAAMTGISGAATVTMGLIALPSMLKRNYDKSLAIGSIAAGGALGILIPPSVAMILVGLLASVSIGRLFAGGVFPGLVLSMLFNIYILIRSYLEPTFGPELPREERLPLRVVLPQFKALIFPTLLILAVLGSIFSGIATPTEAAAVGAFGAIVATAISRKLNWLLVKDACNETLRLSAMVLWLIVGASWFSSVYSAVGGPVLINELIMALGVNRWIILIGMQIVLVLLGMVMETTGIIFITIPVFIPLIRILGFDPVWFGVLFIMNMEMGFLTPPFGLNLFYMKAIVPKGITMGDLYRSIVPFVFLQLLGLIIVMVFPVIATFLPDLWLGG